MEAERKIEHWLMRVTCQLIAAALERIDAELYQFYKAQRWRAGIPGRFTAAMGN